MKLEISKEELRNFLLHATDEQLAEMIEFIHPVDILEVIHEYKEDEDSLLYTSPFVIAFLSIHLFFLLFWIL